MEALAFACAVDLESWRGEDGVDCQTESRRIKADLVGRVVRTGLVYISSGGSSAISSSCCAPGMLSRACTCRYRLGEVCCSYPPTAPACWHRSARPDMAVAPWCVPTVSAHVPLYRPWDVSLPHRRGGEGGGESNKRGRAKGPFLSASVGATDAAPG